MGLYERLLGIEEPRIPNHQFFGALAEIEKGKLSGQEVGDMFAMSASERVEASTLYGMIVVPAETVCLSAQVTLTNIGTTYDAIPQSQGLPFTRLQVNGITGIEFTVRVNKIGGGTQSWQLWNDTDNSEVVVIDDPGAAGIKTISITYAPATALPAGYKTLRVRAKSTTAADDPIFLGATLLIRRVGRLTADEFHQCLLMGEYGLPPYDTVAGIKARFGIP